MTKDIFVPLDGEGPYEHIKAQQCSSDSLQVRVVLLHRNKPVYLSQEVTPRLIYQKPDGKKVVNDCEVEGMYIIVNYTEQMLIAPGTAVAKIYFAEGDEEIYSAAWYTDIYPTVGGVIEESSDEYITFNNYIKEMNGVFDCYIKEATDLQAATNKSADRASSSATDASVSASKAFSYVELCEDIFKAIGAGTGVAGVGHGSTVLIEDSYDTKLMKFTSFGKSVQKTYSGKNLLNNTATSQVYRGITWTVNADGSITANGTATENNSVLPLDNERKPNGTYLLSGRHSQFYGLWLKITYKDGTISYSHSTYKEDNIEVVIDDTVEEMLVYAQVIKDTTISNVTIYPMLRLASITDDTYEPYTGGEVSPNPNFPQSMTSVADDTLLIDDYSLVVKSCGKNLLPNNATTQTINEVIFTLNADKSITVSGTASATAKLEMGYITLPNGAYLVNGGYDENKALMLQMLFKDGTSMYYRADEGDYKILIDDTVDRVRVYLQIYSGITVNNLVFKPMIRYADIEDDTYEPYVSTEANLTLTDSLRGIPVTEGGNYTDEDGQSWICDTIEKYADGTGKYIQRVYGETLTESKIVKVNNAYVDVGAMAYISPSYKTKVDDLQTLIMCNKAVGVSHHDRAKDINMYRICCTPDASAIMIRYPATVGEITLEQAKADFADTEVFYALAEPIELNLNYAQLSELEKLKTFEPYTTIYTDDIGEVEVAYFKNNVSAEYIVNHNHDDEYYRRGTIDGMLSNKSNYNHTHNKLVYTAEKCQKTLQVCEDGNLQVLDTYNQTQPVIWSSNEHTHDGRYYSKEELDVFLRERELPVGTIIINQSESDSGMSYGIWEQINLRYNVVADGIGWQRIE